MPQDFLNNCPKIILKEYENAINHGQSPVEALSSSIEKLQTSIENHREPNNISEPGYPFSTFLISNVTGKTPSLVLKNMSTPGTNMP